MQCGITTPEHQGIQFVQVHGRIIGCLSKDQKYVSVEEMMKIPALCDIYHDYVHRVVNGRR